MLLKHSNEARNLTTNPRTSPANLPTNNEPWVADAKCAELDPYTVDEIFFVEKGGSSARAKEFCKDCPVKNPCSQYAILGGEDIKGYWGGTTDRERKKLRRLFRLEVTKEEVVVNITNTVSANGTTGQVTISESYFTSDSI